MSIYPGLNAREEWVIFEPGVIETESPFIF